MLVTRSKAYQGMMGGFVVLPVFVLAVVGYAASDDVSCTVPDSPVPCAQHMVRDHVFVARFF